MEISKLFLRIKFAKKAINFSILSKSLCSNNTRDLSKESCKQEIKYGDEQNVEGGKKGIVLGVYENDKKFELTSAAKEIDQKSDGKILQHLNELSCNLKLGKAFVITNLVPEYSAIAIASLGPKDPGYNKLEELDETRENVRWGIGAGVTLLKERGCGQIVVDTAGVADAAAEAAELAAWSFDEFKSQDVCGSQTAVSPYGAGGGDGELWRVGALRGRAQNWARYLSDMPANKMTPVDFAQAALDMLCPLGVQVDARDRQWVEAQNMRAFMTVARGSCEPPVFLECTYRGGNQLPPVLVAAKGVTFDSGGLCLKRPQSMVENRGSMAGAAVVVAAIKMLAELKVPLNVNAVIPLCENMVSGQCMKVGDVVQALNGLSIQIEDTDMEGRLMMADALVYGQLVYKPTVVIDVATLTHGVLLATGGGAFGCFSNSEEIWKDVQTAGAFTGDRPWRFPLWHYYYKQVTNDPAVDLRNKGSGKATPCLGAAFLRNFICGDWVHMDITGVGKLAHAPAPPYLHPRRMSGRPARTLAVALQRLADRCRRDQPDKEYSRPDSVQRCSR